MFRRLSFLLVFVSLVVVGTLLRLSGPTLTRDKPIVAASSLLSRTSEKEEDLRLAEQLVLDFYHLVEESEFERVADKVIELEWEWIEDSKPRAIGLIDRAQFIADCEREPKLGFGDYGVIIYKIEVKAVRMSLDSGVPELAALHQLDEAPAISNAIGVDVWGTARIACIVFDWNRQMVVVRTDDDWKLLLPSPSQYSRSRVHAWFPEAIGGGTNQP